MTSFGLPSGDSGDWRAISSRIVEPVIEQHAEEAAFLWLLRDAAVSAAHYSLKDLAKLDDRVEAHLDGLRIAGQFGWEICERGMESGEPGESFPAAVLAFGSGVDDCISKVLEEGVSDAGLRRGLISALGWIRFDAIEGIVKQLLHSEDPFKRLLAIRTYAVHRMDPGQALAEAVKDADNALRAGAAKAAGELGRTDLLSALRWGLSDTDLGCRYFAAWSAARLGARDSASAVAALREVSETASPYAERALAMGLRCADLSQGKSWQAVLKRNPDQLRFAALGAGVLGDPATIPDLVGLMENAEIARVAGEAFSMITGVDLAYNDLDGEQPEGYTAGPTESAEDENVAMDPDEDLPWPAPELIAQWWQKHKGEFRAGVRYLRGKEMAVDSLSDALAKGTQRQRAAAAMELGLREPSKPLFEVRARGAEQERRLSRGA